MSDKQDIFNKIPNFASDPDSDSMVITGQYNGLPYRGPVLNIKRSDPETMLPVLKRTVHVKIFDLSKDEDRQAYEELCTKIAEGLYLRSWEDIARLTDGMNVKWVVCCRYIEEWYGPPLDMRNCSVIQTN